jgi:RNA polymerase sigma factor (sigma-70 family)
MSERQNTPDLKITESITTNLYGLFVDDLPFHTGEVFSHEDINRKIQALRDRHTPAAIKAALKREIVGSVIRIVPFAIGLYRPRLVPPEELIGASYEVIERATVRYQPGRSDASFFGYTLRCLERKFQTISHEFRNSLRPMELSVKADRMSITLRRNWEAFCQVNGREPTQTELLEMSSDGDYPESTLRSLANISIRQPFVPIGSTVTNGRVADDLGVLQGKIEETLRDSDDVDDSNIHRQGFRKQLFMSFRDFDPLEKQIFRLYFGFDDEQECEDSYTRVARKVGLTREEVRGHMAKIMRKLRHPGRVAMLRDYLY